MEWPGLVFLWRLLISCIALAVCVSCKSRFRSNSTAPLTPYDDGLAVAAEYSPAKDTQNSADGAARQLLAEIGPQEALALLGWQQNSDYQPAEEFFDYWRDESDITVSREKIDACEEHAVDLLRLYASYGTVAGPLVFKSAFFWAQSRAFTISVFPKAVEAWRSAGGSEDNASFLRHPVCATSLQQGWAGSEHFYDGNEHPLCRPYKIEALEAEWHSVPIPLHARPRNGSENALPDMNMSREMTDESEVHLVCWLDWYDGPVSGLARRNTEVVWFQMESEAGEEPRRYTIFELSTDQVMEALNWFEEKRVWFETAAPQLRELATQIEERRERERAAQERGLLLREWDGPELCGSPVGKFSDETVASGWFDHARWCPADDFIMPGAESSRMCKTTQTQEKG